jgi:sialidase-1
VFRSEDEGRTFVEEGSIWKRPDSYRVAIPPVIQLSSRRLLLPFCGRGGDHFPKSFAAGCYYSDDDGKSWALSRGRINLPKRGAMEPSVAELDDGTLLMSLRTQLGGPFLSRSTDGGDSWTPAQFSGLEGGESGTCLKRIPRTNRLLLLWNNSKYVPNHHHFGERTPLSAAVSDDDGKTWRKVGTIGDDPQAEYTNLECCFTSQGKAVITYMFAKPAWNRHRIDLRAAIVDVDWFR